MSHTHPFTFQHEFTVSPGKFVFPRGVASGVDWDGLLEATGRLFPGELKVTHEFDPEYPDQQFVVLHVEGHGEIASIVDRESQWVTMLSERAPGRPGIRLFIHPRP